MTQRQSVGTISFLFGILWCIPPIWLLKMSAIALGAVDIGQWVGYAVLGFWFIGLGLHMVFGPPKRSIASVAFPVLTGETTIIGLALVLFSLYTKTVPWLQLWLTAGLILGTSVYFCWPKSVRVSQEA